MLRLQCAPARVCVRQGVQCCSAHLACDGVYVQAISHSFAAGAFSGVLAVLLLVEMQLLPPTNTDVSIALCTCALAI